MVTQALNPSTQVEEAGIIRVSYNETSFKKKKIKPDVVAHAFNPSIWEAESDGSL